MGFGDFFGGIGKAIKSSFGKIGSVFNAGFNDVKKIGHEVFNLGKNFVNGAVQETNHLIDGIENTVKFAIDKGTGVANNAINVTGSSLVGVSSNLALPLAAVGGVLAFVFLTKK